VTSSRRRLDQALVERELVPTRSRARALIMAGQVRVAGQTASKPGTLVEQRDRIEVATPPRFVSRGGDKLHAALEVADIDVRGRTCLDIGASTGGFTDCLLQAGAALVVAVDVGYGQLDYRLRQDDRVRVLERVNARYLTADDLPDGVEPPDLLVVDVAFISVTKVLPAASEVCAPRSDALVLVKPQFECGPDQVGSGGVVSSARVRRDTLRAAAGAAVACSWGIVRAIPSPIRGQAGNWECFLQLSRPPAGTESARLDERNIEIPEG
jgi:23S rRNA (cytidine1920-2'-O)/16S rRNA (cytidine1409-2'-O)-methyltransferase